ncbi:MAG TPA: phosphate ABC transporter permease subunit PstC [Nostocaceae cyanobacterium]|nr:phosphate ABC transporter permease subunit PstC [Nostocaceae cyanobacterium]
MANTSSPSDNNSPDSLNFHRENVDLLATNGSNFWLDKIFTNLVFIFSAFTVIILLLMSLIIFREAQPAIEKFGLGFLWSQEWDTGNGVFGALPYIYGTLVSSAIAIIFAIPVGLSVALVTSENFLPISVKNTIAFVVELIAAIPSVIIGLWGIFVLIPVLEPLQKWIAHHLKFIPLFDTLDPVGTNMLTAGIILSIMILPTIAAISRDVMLAIPQELRSASMALGGTRWETIFRVLLPSGFSGIVSASMLALGRALGETMAVTMVIGNFAQIKVSLLEPAYTIPSVLANEFAEAEQGLHIGSLSYLGLILFGLTLLVNILAVLVIQFVGNRHK